MRSAPLSLIILLFLVTTAIALPMVSHAEDENFETIILEIKLKDRFSTAGERLWVWRVYLNVPAIIKVKQGARPEELRVNLGDCYAIITEEPPSAAQIAPLPRVSIGTITLTDKETRKPFLKIDVSTDLGTGGTITSLPNVAYIVIPEAWSILGNASSKSVTPILQVTVTVLKCTSTCYTPDPSEYNITVTQLNYPKITLQVAQPTTKTEAYPSAATTITAIRTVTETATKTVTQTKTVTAEAVSLTTSTTTVVKTVTITKVKTQTVTVEKPVTVTVTKEVQRIVEAEEHENPLLTQLPIIILAIAIIIAAIIIAYKRK